MSVVHCKVFVLLPVTSCALQIVTELFVLDKSGSFHRWFVVLTTDVPGAPDRRKLSTGWSSIMGLCPAVTAAC